MGFCAMEGVGFGLIGGAGVEDARSGAAAGAGVSADDEAGVDWSTAAGCALCWVAGGCPPPHAAARSMTGARK